MTDKNENAMPGMPSPEEMEKMMAAMMGGGDAGFDPADLLKQMGMGDGAAGEMGDLDIESLMSGGGMSQLTRLFGGGGLERMMGDMMTQFEPPKPPEPSDADVIEAGYTTAMTAETLAAVDDHALVATLVNHAQSNLMKWVTNPEEATLTDEIDVMLTLPEGQRALLITTRAIGTIKMDGLETFATQIVAQDARFLELAAAGFRLLDVPELVAILEKAHPTAVALNNEQAEEQGFDVTDPLVDTLSDLDDQFSEFDFFALHEQEMAFIRENPTLFLDHE